MLPVSPADEPERRLDEGQVEVTLTRGFWMGKYEATQGQWKRIVGKLPGELTPELGEGNDLPLGNVNYAEAEAFCLRLTDQGRRSGALPRDWEFRLPTEAQWEYACRAGTRSATSFGDKLGRTQANFQGTPYNGGEAGPSLNRATKVGSYPANAWGLHDMHGKVYEWCRDWVSREVAGRHRSRSVGDAGIDAVAHAPRRRRRDCRPGMNGGRASRRRNGGGSRRH